MNSQKLPQQICGPILIILLLVGCGAPAVTPTSKTPAATPTPEPPTPVPSTSTPTPEPPTATTRPTAMPAATSVPLFEISSSAFKTKQPIPARHTCHGEDLSPPLAWKQPPPGTESFVLIMDDPDAIDVAGFVWDHWLLFNIPADVLALSEGAPQDAELPDGSRQGQNSFNRLGYGGPCPPSGQTHGYVFTLYAVDTILEIEARASKDEILQAIEGHILAQAQLIGLYTSP